MDESKRKKVGAGGITVFIRREVQVILQTGRVRRLGKTERIRIRERRGTCKDSACFAQLNQASVCIESAKRGIVPVVI